MRNFIGISIVICVELIKRGMRMIIKLCIAALYVISVFNVIKRYKYLYIMYVW
jgi:Na+-transporting NADH:ubiquinone oxidoreductase subunit NqrD